MATSNRVSVEITAAQLTSFLGFINQAAAILPPAPSLSSEERQAISTIGTRLQPFDDAVAEVVPQFPDFVPSYLSTPEATKDRGFRLILGQMMVAIETIREHVRDLDILAGADLFDYDHGVLNTARDAVKRGSIPGADAALDQMEEAYPRRGRRTTPPPAPPTP
ncbi:MAG: hypothetical protein JNG86_19995 [Verrucomicrobiaceae bacterium]|nr:hypothetical protein [Verrucomicrobiaceae bacterium]